MKLGKKFAELSYTSQPTFSSFPHEEKFQAIAGGDISVKCVCKYMFNRTTSIVVAISFWVVSKESIV